MNCLDILIPFALPPAAMAPDLLRSMQTPSLATLLARSRLEQVQESDAFARALPHEYWLAGAADLAIDNTHHTSPSAAIRSLVRFDPTQNDGNWFVLNPVHIHIARDHLVLTDLRRLALDEDESKQLFALAQPLFADYGHAVVYGDATTWFLRADAWHDLCTATPDAACGHNIDIWMPTGSAERAWRKLQNEIQMHWHDAPVNQTRQAIGKNPVNSLWLWGGARAHRNAPKGRYQNAFMPTESMQYFGVMADNKFAVTDIAAVISSAPSDSLLVLDDLIEPALGDDLGEWLMRINALEALWFAPLIKEIKSGVITQCRFILTNGVALHERSISQNTLRKFWQAPSLSALLT